MRTSSFWQFAAVCAVLSCASVASAQISLTPSTVPATSLAGGIVAVTGSGYNSGLGILSAQVTVTPAGGSPVVAVLLTPLPIASAASHTLQFQLPASLTTSTLALACQVSVGGTYAGGTTFSTLPAKTASLTINPAATVASVSPGSGVLGAPVTITVTGSFTSFNSLTAVSLVLPAVSPSIPTTILQTGSTVYSALNPTQVQATFNIPGTVPTGAYTVIAKSGTQIAQLVGGFLVYPAGPLTLASISPSTLTAGLSSTIQVVGGTGANATHFVQNTTVAAFGNGINPGPVTVADSNHASFQITTDPIAFLGPRTLTMTTGGEYATGTFTLTTNGSSLSTVGTTAPTVCPTACSAPQGANATLKLTGVGTHWIQAGTNVTVGPMNTGNIVVTDPTHLTVNVSVAPSLAVGSYPVTVTTNGEVVSLANAFSVTISTPYLSLVSPNTGAQGQVHEIVTFTGFNTSFTTGAISANFGPNITVNSVTPTTALAATADISIDSVAFAGGRTCSLTSNGTIYNFAFTVTASGAALTGITPTSGFQESSVTLQVSGAGTHWAPGLTFASMGAGIIINEVSVTSATAATVSITIPASAPIGVTSITMSTNGEVVTLNNAFTVLAYTPTLTLAPSSGMIPTAPATSNIVNVTLTGDFTHFVNGHTVAAIDGNGVSIQNLLVINKWNATAQFVITAPPSQASPALPCSNIYGGNHIVTLETPLTFGAAEILYAGFCVTSTPAVLTSITPYHSLEPVTTLPITITGQYTHFEAGVTTVGFGPLIAVGPVIVAPGGLSLQTTITIPANAPLGWHPVFVNTVDPAHFINEQLTIGYHIDAPASASLVSVTPNTATQGQSITVQIIGNLTNWSLGNTIAIFGTGITVNSLTINNTSSATAQISVDAVNAPIGGSSVTMVTQLPSGNEEVVSGPAFFVTAGIATIDHLGSTCSANYTTANTCQQHLLGLNQGDITSFNVFGLNTHWLQGETTLNFGPDIAISQLVVNSPTSITCQIAISYNAIIGYRGGTATTNAEIAPSFSDALNIMALQPVGVTIDVHSAKQGTTFDIAVNGTSTHWTSSAGNPLNNTTASFGNNNGVNVTGITVISPTQMTLHMHVLGTAVWYPSGLYSLTITTTGLPVDLLHPQGTEQIILNNVFNVTQGAAIITYVNPTSGVQSSTTGITVTGQNTSFATGVTTALFSTSGCLVPTPAGINVNSVTASSLTSATLSIAVSATAPTGYQTLCMYTGGEIVSYSNAFQVLPGTPTLNGVSQQSGVGNTYSGQQGQTIAVVNILGQYTHWQMGVTTMTFGEGITVQNLIITGPTTATATLVIDPTAYLGLRTTTVTTGSEVVNGNYFTVTVSDAIINTISPTSANQGQHILLTINGNFTHWSQELTQFSISGGGYDIKVNGVVINSPTQAVADLSILTISGNNGLGTRTINMSTVGENVSLQAGFLITGGVPSISSISPNYGTRGDTADTVQIAGIFTLWDATSVVDFGDPAIVVSPTSTVNSSTSITAVIGIGAGATLGVHTVTVRTGVAPNFSTQLGQYTVYNPAAPPTPYISYEYPSVALVGQTLAVALDGAYTNWLPGQTTASFGAGILVNDFHINSLTSATANITIQPGSTVGPRVVSIITGGQTLTTSFYVTVGTPAITVVTTSTAIEGESRLLDLVGQYTTWGASTVFAFCPGVTSVSNVQIFGPTAARVEVTISQTAAIGYCPVTATTGSEVAQLGGGGYFGITPSVATIQSVSPNTALQNTTTPLSVSIVGFATNWDNTTVFSFGSGVSIQSKTVTDHFHATVTIETDLYATPGYRTVTAQTGGEYASLNNAFVIQPGTPILLSTTNASNEQQAAFSLGILGDYTNWTNLNTTVQFPNGGVTGLAVNVTSATSITVTGTVLPTAYPGCGPVVVTTTGQIPPVLTLYSGFCITPGPAAITGLSPNNLGQGQSHDILITGTNTNWSPLSTVANFGPGISVNTLNVTTATTATANVTVAANATPEANTVTLTTAGETSRDVSGFTIFAATPVLLDVYPNTGTQGLGPFDVCVTGAFTHFVNGTTTADFGPGITVNSVNTATFSASCPGFVNDGAHADVRITITPTAATSPGNTNHVRLITNLASPPGAQEVAIWENSSATTQYNFAISAGGATILSATPTTPATVHQNDVGDVIEIVGSGTNFVQGTTNVAFCGGVTPVGVTVHTLTTLTATVSVGTYATVGACGVTVTTGGEVAIKTNAFSVLAGIPVLTQVNPNSEPQNAGTVSPIPVTITGLYTHFTSGALAAVFPAGVTGTLQPGYTDTSATWNVAVSPTAAVAAGTVTVSDTGDPSIPSAAFTVTGGVPALVSLDHTTGGQGSVQTVTLTGNYTGFWNGSSVVTVSGPSDVLVTGTPVPVPLANGYQWTMTLTFSVTNGASATARTVTVTTPGQTTVSLPSAFTVLPGSAIVQTVNPNFGIPNSTFPVTITGAFTNWDSTTTISIGTAAQGIHVNGAAAGVASHPTSYSATSLTMTLTVDSGAPLSTDTVTVTTTTGVLQILFGSFTVQANTTTPPVVQFVSPANSVSGVPTNTQITVTFSEPLNPATIVANNAAYSQTYYPATSFPQAPGSPSLDVSGRVLTITPAANLNVGQLYYVSLNSYQAPGGTPTISDGSGNHLAANQEYQFTTGFAPDLNGPTFLMSNIANGATGVPTNSKVVMGFDKPINPGSMAAGLTIMQAGNPVPGTWSYSTDFTQAIFTPSPSLAAGLPFTVSYNTSLTGTTGIGLTSAGTLNFQTGAGPDTSALSLLSYNPVSNAHVPGTNPMIRIRFNKPVDPLSFTPSVFYLRYNDQISNTILGTSPSFSPDNTTVTMNLSGPLLPGTQYYWYMCSVYDWTTVNSTCNGQNFITGPALDNSPPSAQTWSPVAGATGVPVNPAIYIHFSKALDPTTVTNTSISLSPFVAGTVGFSTVNGTDYTTLVFVPSTNLTHGQSYILGVSGLGDQDGNAMSAFAGSTFTVVGSGAADTTHGTISGTPTPSGATNIPTNSQIVLTFSKVVDPLTLNPNSVHVWDNSVSGGPSLPGTLLVDGTGTIVTYTPAQNYVANHQICYYISYNANVYDLAGNYFNYMASCFTTGSTVASTAPVVSFVSPLNGATGIGPSNPVIVTFSEPVNPGTLGSNVALYNGSTLVTSSYSPSSDYTTIVFNNSYLPFSTTFTVVVNPNVTDLFGNHLAAEFSSTFATGPAPMTSQPTVTTMRPGSGATGVSATNPITLFFSAPMAAGTLGGTSIKVSQNGTLISPAGTFTPSAGNQAVAFVPGGGAFQAGAVIQVWVTSAATDTAGNPAVSYQSQFTIQADLTATHPNTVSYYPQCCGNSDLNTVAEILLNKPIASGFGIGNFYVTDTSNHPVSGSVQLLDNGRLMRFTPTTTFPSSGYYYIHATTGLLDSGGLGYAGSSTYEFYVSNPASLTAPSVIATSPTNSASGIGVNAVIGVTFSKNVDASTLDPSGITLNGGAIPLTISYNATTFSMTVTPQSPLPAVSTITLAMAGVTDPDGNALTLAGSTLSFQTSSSPDYSAPVLVQTNIASGQTGVPVTTSISLMFNKPIDFRSVSYGSSGTIYLYDYSSGYLAGAVSPIGSSGVLITHPSALPVNHHFYFEVCNISDLNGNLSACTNRDFYTALTAPGGGPVVIQAVPANTASGVPVNFEPMVQFDRPVNPAALSGITLSGGGAVAATPVLSSGGTVVTLVPNSILSPNTAYTFSVSGVQDSAGNTQAGSVSRSFQTGPGVDLINPSVLNVTPLSNSTTGENPVMQLLFSEPLNPITSSAFTFYNLTTGRYVTGVNLLWSGDFQSVQLTNPVALEPNSRYVWYLNNMVDLAGNSVGSPANYFYTGSAPDSSPESVQSVSPPSGISGVPLNAPIVLRLAKPVAPVSVNNSVVTLTPSVPTAIVLSSDGLTMTVTHGVNFAPSTPYTVNVATGAFSDENGNGVAIFSSNFTTGTSTDSTQGTINLTNPVQGTLGVPLTQAITVTFNKPINPLSVTQPAFEVYENNNGNLQIAGTVTNPTVNTLVFTPSVALPANATIDIYVGYDAHITDLAGNTFNYLYNASFNTANTPDNSPPQVVSVKPGNGASNVGPYAPVIVTFNKSLNYNTITPANFALYNGTTNLNASVSYSADRSMVTLSSTLPYSASLMVAISTNVQDYNGNNMVSPCAAPLSSACTYSFSTETPPLNSHPSVIQARPSGSGAALNSPITLFTSSPMNLSSVQNGMFVAQNGALIPGTVSLTADQRGIVWTPFSNYASGALIEVYLTSPATDTSGNLVTNYSTSFHTVTAPSTTTAPTVTAYNPGGTYLANPVVEAQFSEPLNPATVTAATAFVKLNNTGSPVSGTPILLNNNTLLRVPLNPTAVTTFGAYYYLNLTTGIQDNYGNSYGGTTTNAFYVYPTAAVDNTPPTVTVTPVNGAGAIGDNAPVRLVFSKLVDTLTINPSTVTLTYGPSSTVVPYTISFSTINSGTQTSATLTPQSPLPDGATITVSLTGGSTGIIDLAGNPLASQVSVFTTMSGADFNGPVVTQQSVDSHNNSAVPVNTTFTLVFSKPLDPATVISGSGGFYIYDYSTGYLTMNPVNVSVDGRTVTMSSAGNLPASHNMYYEWCSMTDLDGNSGPCSDQGFTTASATDTVAPFVVGSNPQNGNTTTVPTNAMIEVIFNEAVRATSLGAITLTRGASTSVPVTSVLNNTIYTDDTVVRIVPQQLLLPNTAYTVSVSGVQDVAGNTMSPPPYSFTFTTGPNFQTVGLTLPPVTVTTTGGTVPMPTSGTLPNVLDSPTFTVTFDHALDTAAATHGATFSIRDSSYNIVAGVTVTPVLSVDQKTVTVTTSGLASGTLYRLGLEYGSAWLYDIAGNQTSGWSSQTYAFTTH